MSEKERLFCVCVRKPEEDGVGTYSFSLHLGGGVTVLGTVNSNTLETVVSTGPKVTIFSVEVVPQAVLSQV